ncbi:MAG TPA: DUF4349 domain-containing protein [Acidimicrobiia bacterium]|nr:DUF4349 domain-containing protein [Acidimicrobiia bacterium]
MKRVSLSLVALCLLLAACGANTTSATTAARDELSLGGSGVAPNTTAPSAEGGGDQSAVGVPAVDNRQVIYDGSIQLQSADTRDAFDRIVLLVETSGGFLAASQVGEAIEEEQPVINFTIRIPTDELRATLAGIREVADRVVTESLQSQDVTEQFVDIEAQLRNLYVLEEELLALLSELRDNPNADPSKLLQVFDQIRITRGEIEQLEGRKQLLADLVSLATISISISPLPAAIPIVPEDPVWEPAVQAREALRSLVEDLQAIGSFAIRFVLYNLPILVLIAGPFVWLAWFLYRRVKRANVSPPPAPTNP